MRKNAVTVSIMYTCMMCYIQDEVYISRLERLCDAVVRVESFAGSEKEQNPLFQEYHGQCKVR